MGNAGCGCSTALKDDSQIENLSSQPNPKSQNETSCFKYVNFDSEKLTESSERPFEMQGEMFRVQRGLKEVLVPRWCVLNVKAFKYYKNKFSAACEESPLFEIMLSKIICGRAFRKRGEFCIEISFFFESASGVVWEGQREVLGEAVNGCVKIGRGVEVVVFVVGDKKEWVKWARGILGCIKVNLNKQ